MEFLTKIGNGFLQLIILQKCSIVDTRMSSLLIISAENQTTDYDTGLEYFGRFVLRKLIYKSHKNKGQLGSNKML